MLILPGSHDGKFRNATLLLIGSVDRTYHEEQFVTRGNLGGHRGYILRDISIASLLVEFARYIGIVAAQCTHARNARTIRFMDLDDGERGGV